MTDLVKSISDRFGLNESTSQIAFDFLKQFGHLIQTGSDVIGESIARYQLRLGLPITAELDRITLREMVLPRCGLPDHAMMTEEAKWRRKDLSYFIESYVGGISQGDQDDLIALGWKQWSDVADIKFSRTQSKSQANIVVTTGQGRQSGFDGPLGTLAWANLPQGNDAQLQLTFDIDETWAKSLSQNQRAILFLNVMTHEAGHALGLDHSSQRSALMYPTYDPSVSKPQQVDDIPRIAGIYGSPTSVPSPSREAVDEIWMRGVSGKWIEGYKIAQRLF